MAVFIEVILDNVYSSAMGRLKCTSSEQFTLKLPEANRLVALEVGEVEGECLKSMLDKGVYTLKLTICDLIHEVPIGCAEADSSVATYGMQYYPYLSSVVQLDIQVIGTHVACLTLVLPEAYRVIWFQALEGACMMDDIPARMQHSQGEKESAYIFLPTRQACASACRIQAKVPVVLGGKEYMRALILPVCYFVVSMLLVPLLALEGKLTVTFGAVLAFAVFVVRNLVTANVPQFNTVLRDIYLAFVAALFVWAFAWGFGARMGNTLLVLAILPALGILMALWWMGRKYKTAGVLPGWLVAPFYWLRKNRARDNRKQAAEG